MRATLVVASALLSLLGAASCEWETCRTLADGTQVCGDEEPAMGDGQIDLTCSDFFSAGVPVVRSLSGPAQCSYSSTDGLLVQVTSETCDSLTVRLRDFNGPGRYRGDGAADGPVQVLANLVVPDTGCSDSYLIQSYPNAACSTTPNPCTVEVTGDIDTTQGGDMKLTITCGQLVFNHPPEGCGICQPQKDMTLDIEGCTFGG
ncbi:hypothetical protein [Chondromyces crocatus]|uniref:Secreted protein n=1 Tax=Chondromyces crocatus TaxID=52 RepID=A0A0K1E956_CHOCO|nr:hypothetical protein [Chondromyces crocatus]AKT37207.1 uncharacterized protein CMC5_013370 [Chondromyces crocatus]